MATVCSLVYQLTSYGDCSLFLMRHWVPERIEFKIAVLTHKVLCSAAPRYLVPLNHVADVSGRRSLHSSGTNRLIVPQFRLSAVGSRASLPISGNALQDSLVSIKSAHSFQRHLKTFLFQRSFLLALQWT